MIITHTVPSAGRELTITRTLDATPDVVFEAWIEPERAREWMGPRGFRAVHLESDPRPGGKWRICLCDENGQELWQGGVYREIVANERLVFTLAWDQKVRPGHETTVTVNFIPKGTRTSMTFQQGAFESMSERDGHRAGWNSTFDRLSEHVREA